MAATTLGKEAGLATPIKIIIITTITITTKVINIISMVVGAVMGTIPTPTIITAAIKKGDSMHQSQ